ncbi:MAG: thermonuclease family protein [Pseudomonadota bacterium]
MAARWTLATVTVSAGLLVACGAPSPLADMQAGEEGRVVRILDGDSLVLDTGQTVRLVGIEAPSIGRRGAANAPYAEDARRALEDLAMGRRVRLYYPGLTRDRYDRALAHVHTEDQAGPPLWLNAELLKQGAVRARFYPDTDAGSQRLLDEESEARRANRGLWRLSAYAAQPAPTLKSDARGFTLITATLGTSSPPSGPFADRLACQRSVEGTPRRLDVRQAAAAMCELADGTRIEMRVWVSEAYFDLSHPLHVEILLQPGAD